ncbi:MAG: hypothetical protein JW863_01645 [Chitinispirillaceae bacterium]|nr:hypothetical protein [Chitinispirillaceae bacterium]
MNNLLLSAAGTIMIGVLASMPFAQGAYFGYVEEPVQPRSAAMGGSGTARGTGGFSFYNPAGPATLDRPFVAFEYGQQWSDLTRGYVETALLFPQWFIGGSFQTQGVSFSITDETGSEILPGEGTEQASQLTLLTGWRNDRFAIAVAANGLQHHLYDADAFALSASGGITYSVIPGKLYTGAAVLHAGRLHRGFFDNAFHAGRDSMPTTGRIGISWDDTLFGKLPVTAQVDGVYSLNYSKVMVPVGIELRPVAPLAIRVGKRFNHPTDLLTCGIGVSWANLSYNLALIPTSYEGDAGLKWSMGLSYALAVKKRRKPADSTTGSPSSVTGVPDSSQSTGTPDTTVDTTAVSEPSENSMEQPAADSSTADTVSTVTSDTAGTAVDTSDTSALIVPDSLTETTPVSAADTPADAGNTVPDSVTAPVLQGTPPEADTAIPRNDPTADPAEQPTDTTTADEE